MTQWRGLFNTWARETGRRPGRRRGIGFGAADDSVYLPGSTPRPARRTKPVSDPAYPIELHAPDITPYKDGNEVCGAIARELLGAPRLTEKERYYPVKGLLG